MRIIAVDAANVGKVTVNEFEAVLMDPKLKTHTAWPVVALYIKPPTHVKDAGVQVTG
jgi:hypothetical protein